MAWQFTDDVTRYAPAVEPVLTQDPARHTIGLTVIEGARGRQASDASQERYGWYSEPDGAVTGACSLTVPYPLLVEAAPSHTVRELVEHAVRGDDDGLPGVTGVNAPSATAAEFAAVWTARTGGSATLVWAQRLFALDTLRRPDPLPHGQARRATTADRDLVVTWAAGFARDAAMEDEGAVVASVLRRFDAGAMYLWVGDDGQPVAMAGHTEPAAGVARVGPVYTPAQHRNRGYGAAVTAAVTAEALTVAPAVVLFTDLANPTSNALYPRLGYRPLTDRTVFRLTPQ